MRQRFCVIAFEHLSILRGPHEVVRNDRWCGVVRPIQEFWLVHLVVPQLATDHLWVTVMVITSHGSLVMIMVCILEPQLFDPVSMAHRLYIDT